MPVFLYQGYDNENKVITGKIKASNEAHGKQLLESQGFHLVKTFSTQTKTKKRIVTYKELSVFCKQMAMVFFSNMSISEGILLLSSQTDPLELKITLGEIHKIMETGVSFGEAVRVYPHIFTPYMISMVGIGETSGTLDITFQNLGEYFEKEDRIRKKVKNALTYPLVLTVLMAVMVFLLVLKILPTFNDILVSMGGKLPSYTKAILITSLWIKNYFIFLVIVFFVFFFFLRFYFQTEKGSYFLDGMKLNLPFQKYLNQRVLTTRFARSLAILLKSGIPLLNAFDYIAVLMENKYIEKKYQLFTKDVKEGKDWIASIKKLHLFPPLLIRMITIGNETGHLDEMLEKSAVLFDEEVEDALEKIVALLEPLLIIILSIIVGIILISVMIPMTKIMATLG